MLRWLLTKIMKSGNGTRHIARAPWVGFYGGAQNSKARRITKGIGSFLSLTAQMRANKYDAYSVVTATSKVVSKVGETSL